MTARDAARLAGVHPRLVEAIREVLAEMAAEGAAMFVVEGVRTPERQQQLYAEGRSVGGRIVTYKDGVTHRSNHQPHGDGFGYAVDCAFVNARDPFDHTWPWEAYGKKLEARGLVWGGRWRMGDLPHAELPDLAKLLAATMRPNETPDETVTRLATMTGKDAA